MALVEPQKPQGSFTETVDGLELVVPAKRNWFITGFLGIWLCGWAFGEVSAATLLITGEAGGSVVFLLFWLAMWTLGGGFALYAFFWAIVGRERVLLGPALLSIRREIFGFSFSKEYALENVTNLRVSPQPYNPFDFRSGLQIWGIGGGLIAFDHGAATVRFAGSVEESEAASIVERLEGRGLGGG